MTAIETRAADWAQDCHPPLHPEADGGQAGTVAVGRSLLLDGIGGAAGQLGTEFCKGFWEKRKIKDLTERP